MGYHIQRGIRFTTDIEHKSLYQWALQEVAQDGSVIDRDQIPWAWTLYFSGTEIRYSRNVQANGAGNNSEDHETIQIDLTPCVRGNRMPRYSMFGTSLEISDITLTARRADKDSSPQRCQIWGIVSYTLDDGIRHDTQPDMLSFDVELADRNFDDLRQAAISGGEYSIHFTISRVAGFYSDWSPDIYTDQVKVLTAHDEHHVELPPDITAVPRLGEIGEFTLAVERRATLSKRCYPLKVDEINDVETKEPPPVYPIEREVNASLGLAEIRQLQRSVRAVGLPLWLMLLVTIAAVLQRMW